MEVHAIRFAGLSSLFLAAAIVLAITACKPAYVAEERQLEDLARVKVNATNLQAWAVEYLSTHHDSDIIPLDAIPQQVRQLFQQEPDAYMMQEKSGERAVWIVWGGGFGHRGFCIGQSQFKAEVEDRPLFLVEWIPGVYFCSQTR